MGYILTGQTFFGSVQPRPGVSSYLISKLRNGRPAAKFRAMIYAPGCAIRNCHSDAFEFRGPILLFRLSDATRHRYRRYPEAARPAVRT